MAAEKSVKLATSGVGMFQMGSFFQGFLTCTPPGGLQLQGSQLQGSFATLSQSHSIEISCMTIFKTYKVCTDILN